MEHIAIAYFSGTGNTWTVAHQYLAAISGHGLGAELIDIEGMLRRGTIAHLADHHLLGLGYPVHAWNAPRLVHEFLSRLPHGAGQRIFVFLTAGYSAAGAFDWLRRRLTDADYQVIHEAVYYMGLYYVDHRVRSLTPAQLARHVHWCAADVREAVEEITAGRERQVYGSDTERLLLSDLGSRLYRWGCAHARRALYATSACTGCGLCAETCPTKNIAVAERTASFGEHCTLCLRCLGLCPEGAIQLTSRTEHMGRYLAPDYAQHLLERTSMRAPSRV